jgi:UDP-N-acetylmuramoyl-L-alanyl-D-glutamate--2,6-diaminopimelate ligase
MISLKALVQQAYPNYPGLDSLPEVIIKGLECDSRKIEKDFLFVMIQGEKRDGRQFADEAIRRGAAALVGDSTDNGIESIPFILVPECRLAASKLASVFYGHPNQKIKVVGITGTNGKTTSSYLIEHFIEQQKKKTGVMGTVNYRFAEKTIPAVETTPGPLRVQQILSEMINARCEFAVMEVSSHALNQNRVSGIDFEAALFTNLTQDHLDYHKTMEEYFECKSRLFTNLLGDKAAVVNVDDVWGTKLLERVRSKIITYGVDRSADLQARNIQFSLSHTEFDLVYQGLSMKAVSPLVGLHNVYNVLGSLGVVAALGLTVERAVTALNTFKGVPGRLESVSAGQSFYVFIDYAHTPDGLENVLRSLRPYKQRKFIVVFGCGGERDKGKRPKMGRIASDHSDYVYVTSDNPRSENPMAIAKEVCAGFPANFKNYSIVIDRRKAIRQALLSARDGDIVLLAGKGHETTQVIEAQALPFSDHEEAKRVLHGR